MQEVLLIMQIGGNIFVNGTFHPGTLTFTDTISDIRSDDPKSADLCYEDCYVIPGLVDIHTHAAMGEDVSDGKPEALPILSRYYAAQGVTSWLPTTMTISEEELFRVMDVVREFDRPQDGAKLQGVHMEGPFINPKKCGAQAPENALLPDIRLFDRLQEASGNRIRLITIAPELPGAMEFISHISGSVTVSLGHTLADYETSMEAYRCGASHATHLYNAMPALQHRAPGVIGAALDADATVELICDGNHVDPSVIRLTHAAFRDRLVLISDSLRCAGMPDGEYMLSGHPIELKDGKATLKGTDTFAGSSIHLMDAVRCCVSFGLPLEAVVTAATLTPAKAVHLEARIGSIDIGKAADLVVLDRDLQVKAIYIDGIQI